ncbi:hypothetical protein HHK36_019017 [Tetracentron sinense]|uniref:Uncharacterized protein n=1 Tax=Tetracentron sinense TaxID=13715 RepID=A0A834Z1G3_TETSI|nr:hypothetical protein HHK36_019017 [Tetracentron sinense]
MATVLVKRFGPKSVLGNFNHFKTSVFGQEIQLPALCQQVIVLHHKGRTRNAIFTLWYSHRSKASFGPNHPKA